MTTTVDKSVLRKQVVESLYLGSPHCSISKSFHLDNKLDQLHQHKQTMAGPVRQPINIDSLSSYIEKNVPEIKLPISVKQVPFRK